MATRDTGFRDLRKRAVRDPEPALGPRGRQRRNLWWLRDFRDRMGPGMIVAFMALVLLVIALLVVRYFVIQPDVVEPPPEPSIYEDAPVSSFGREISPARRLQLARFGIPLYVGPRGVPLIREPVTGEVREVTEQEMNFPEGETEVRSPDNVDAMTAPGPHGRGVQWWEPRHLQDLPEPRPVDRVRWYQLQERQINSMIADLSLAIDYVGATPPRSWDDRWGRELVGIARAIIDKYAYGNPDYWVFASRFVWCDTSLENAMTSGVGGWCPSGEFAEAVAQVYIMVGEVVARLDRIGRAAQLPYDHLVGEMYRESEVAEYQIDTLAEIRRILADVAPLFEELHRYGEAHGHYLDLRMP